MSDVMRIQPFATQLRRILAELERNGSIFDIHRSLFWKPVPDPPYAVPDLFGKFLATPVGPSAGPHTQLSQNIVSSWLCGGRFIELKTVQVKDDLVIPRPCIDMTDEGYNVEWSQELKLEESAHEYVVAWALLHLLPRVLGWDENVPASQLPGVIFDMSVGYNLEGIRDPRMTRFMDTLADASAALAPVREAIARDFPRFADISVPARIVNSVTLSTMHGCPPDEIERIARYLLEERGLHTVVKLNPTLLGKPAVLEILHGHLGFSEIDIPDEVFEHDLKYDQALALIASLKQAAAGRGLIFGVKLSNTLAMRNRAGRLPGDEMYMSGRALYPVTMALYDRLLHDCAGDLHVSYSGGADAVNVPTILACGAVPVTGCTDLLKPGGFARMTQWVENVGEAMARAGAGSLGEWAAGRLVIPALDSVDELPHGDAAAVDPAAKGDLRLAAARSPEGQGRPRPSTAGGESSTDVSTGIIVRRAAAEAIREPRYKKSAYPFGLPKVASGLGLWDCVVAPCVEACDVEQDVPEYAWLVAEGQYDRALEVILARNPLPGVTGYVCTHLCQTRCTRNDYEETVAIRALKRIAEERGRAEYLPHRKPATGRRVAIVGSGPSGLAAAAFLALNGVQATIFESRDVPGGMMRLVPPFRLPLEIIDRDIARIAALGVEIRLNSPVAGPPEHLLERGFDAVYLASGFQRDAPLPIPGADGPGVIAALNLLDRSRRGHAVDLPGPVVVIGGGDTAMDAVRTSRRLTGQPVTILYRRTRREMPAAEEELEGALDEGNTLEELVSPLEVLRDGGRVAGLRCVRNALGEAGPDGRRAPRPIPGSEFVVPCASVVVAVGQLPELTFLDGSRVSRHKGGGVLVDGTTRCAGPEGVYAGGDVVIEPGSIISACADGRKAAEAICEHLGVPFAQPQWERPVLSEAQVLDVKRVRARRVPQLKPAMLPPRLRGGFDLIESTFTEDQARAEGLRCVQCTTFCDKCVEVCPNRANYTFRLEPVSWRVPVVSLSAGRVAVVGEEAFDVVQDRQILHVDDFCNECDNCQTFCVHRGKPYIDKPRLFLDEALFEAEDSNAFRIEGRLVRRRENGVESRLVVEDDGVTYEDGLLRLRLDASWRILDAEAKAGFEGPRSLRPAAEMALLHRGITNTLGYLLTN